MKVFQKVSKSRSHISNALRLLTLPSDVVAMLEEGSLTSGQTRPLIGISNVSSIAKKLYLKVRARRLSILAETKSGKIAKTIDANILKTQEKLQKILG